MTVCGNPGESAVCGFRSINNKSTKICFPQIFLFYNGNIMSSSKKKSISDQIPKPISIKKEKSEEDRTLHPISHYIDDRLELVKQIFGTLKPKTIMNLAPEFLKKTNLDEIEEMCLNELLCISTKRLKSIIEDTRCPTDTESSEDSDVERKEEHISLEEISSDSDIGGSENRRAKKLRKSSAKRAEKPNENKESDGQISVLELLELQARARAIRSQLAMEPITKIEVKSDDDEESPEKPPVKEVTKERRNHKSSSGSKRRTSEQTSTKVTNKAQPHPQSNGSNAKEGAAPTKKIKLKRNYRTTKTPEKQVVIHTVTEEKEKKSESNQEQPKSRSGSPDVIPIPAEPETLLISDSTDDEGKEDPKEAKQVTSTEGPEAAASPPPPAVESEPEEGEVRDESEPETETQSAAKVDEQNNPKDAETTKEDVAESMQAKKSDEKDDSIEKIPEESAIENENKEPEVQADPGKEQENEQPIAVIDDEDQNDDVISIGGDLEMMEELTKEDEPTAKVKTEAPAKQSEPDEEDNDVISLNTSDDDHEKLEEDKSESWRTRYLKSSKVSQVLAASRLGKRVRDKIKKSNRAQKRNETKDGTDEKASQQQQQFTSKHEDGSIEQYQELLQHHPRKSSNSSKGDK